jgi:uncharacterized membrane protein
MKMKVLFSVMSGTFMLAGQAFAQPYRFVPIDVHCPETAAASACPAGLAPGQVAAQTSARGVNSHGDIVGSYVVGGRQHGFLLTRGQFISLDVPVPGVRATIANGINARGEIVGQYTAPVHDSSNPPPQNSPLYCPSAGSAACIKGFYYWSGQFSTVMFPTTVDENGELHHHPGAIAQRITADGDIYGCVHDHDLGPSMYGAAWTRSGTFSLLSNGGQLADAMDIPMSMNNGGTPGGGQTIVGLFVDMSNQQHGYVVRNGMLAPYDPDGANLTAIWDINPSHQFVGTFRYSGEPPAKRHGFLQNADSLAPITLDFTCEEPTGCAGAPLGTVAFATIAFGVNSGGVVVGQYTLVSGGAVHGFVAIPPDTN